MRTFAPGLAAHYAKQNTTLAAFLEITRKDGVVLRYTGASRNVVVDGQLYRAARGLGISSLDFSAGLAVDKLEYTVFPDDDETAEVDILAGRWDFARYRLFETSYVDPTIGINVLRRGWTGQAESTRGGYKIELRSLKQALQQQLGEVTTKTCRARLGDDRCKVDLAPWTHDYVVTAVASRLQFTCAAAVEAAEYYKEGIVRSTDAANDGYERKIKGFTGGVFTLALPMPFDVEVGDAFTFIAGCQKRLLEDCKTKFDNILNFQGEPHLPGPDLLMADPDVGGSDA